MMFDVSRVYTVSSGLAGAGWGDFVSNNSKTKKQPTKQKLAAHPSLGPRAAPKKRRVPGEELAQKQSA